MQVRMYIPELVPRSTRVRIKNVYANERRGEKCTNGGTGDGDGEKWKGKGPIIKGR